MQSKHPIGGNACPRVSLARATLWLLAGVLIGAETSLCFGAPEGGFLRASGHDIVNENGQPVMLRGVGLGNWMLPEGYMWKFGSLGDRPRRIEKVVADLVGPGNANRFWSGFRKNYITEADIRRMAELGYNSVRPALNARLFLTESDPPLRVEEGYQLLDNLVKWCSTHGIYVIIDMHGAPGGQTGQNIDDSANDQPELFMEAKHQDRLVALWTSLARRYKNEPTVAGYDLLNEPLPGRTGAAAKFKHLVEPLYIRLTKAIREVDAKHMIVLEGVDWSNDWSVFTEPFDGNLVYQFHYYCWDTPARLRSIKGFLDRREQLNAPVWVGETGERDNAIYWATTEYFEANNIGWSFWPWKKMDSANAPCSIKRPQHWDAVAAYTRGESKPAKDIAQKAFDELLVNIRIENCAFHTDVVNAMFRRAPARIEAENFGHHGASVSYSVKDPAVRSEFYRLEEPVRIQAQEARRPHSNQYISLAASEWTAYTIHSEETKPWEIRVRARAVEGPAEVALRIGERSFELTLTPAGWTEAGLGDVPLVSGPNQLKWVVKRGAVDLDWLDVREFEKSVQSDGREAAKAMN